MMIICPLCQQVLTRAEKRYFCTNSHSFDMAKEGYVNLLPVQHKKSRSPGDTPHAVQARRDFLQQAHYEPLREAIREMLAPIQAQRALDIGCGEGYYTQMMSDCVAQVYGLDIAKSAVKIAAKRYPAVMWMVASGAKLPFAAHCIDIVSSFFSPLPTEEMLRVLKPDGYLLMVTPAANHLYELRDALFETVQPHTPAKFIENLKGAFELIEEQTIAYPLDLSQQDLVNLIAMTPYAWKAKADNRRALEAQAQFATQANFQIYLFKALARTS